MNIYGIDFTSAPNTKKPITCAVCELVGNSLKLNDCLKWSSFAEFEEFLCWDGPWLAALDFPFGQPRKLTTELGWPETWDSYVEVISLLGKQGFKHALLEYCASKPVGEKLALRRTDVLARARSPMMLYRVPVAKMFFQGATRLRASGVSVLPCRLTDDSRMVVEGYPALVARRWIGKASYKSDERARQTADQSAARGRILAGLRSSELVDCYGCLLEMSEEQADVFVEDAMGDVLDALLCAVQAAWAYSRRDDGYGIPRDCVSAEGWIVDVSLLLQVLDCAKGAEG
jgi:hypothetical protein